MTPDDELRAYTERFADEVADLLTCTVADNPPIAAEVAGPRVVVAPYSPDGTETDVPLTIEGEPRLDLRVRYRCTWDFERKFLAVEDSAFSLTLPGLREPLVRVEYQRSRSYAAAHVQVHAESTALGFLFACKGDQTPGKVQALHLPVGGKRFRPCLEDVIEFAYEDLGVDMKQGWRERVEEGRAGWRQIQLAAALRDIVRRDPDAVSDELLEAVTAANDVLLEHHREQ